MSEHNHELSERDDPYALLGVDPDATAVELTAAYRRRVRAAHPDSPGGDAELLRRVIGAYELLRDPQRRAEYDRRTRPRTTGVPIRVRVRRPSGQPREREPDLRAGPVRWHT